jgi:hypothetical protein
MSPVIIENIMVTNGPVSLMALKRKVKLRLQCDYDLPGKEQQVEPGAGHRKHKQRLLIHPEILSTADTLHFLIALAIAFHTDLRAAKDACRFYL